MAIKGIDVSYYQGSIDWKKVKASGVEVAIIRAGYGKTAIDNKFKANIEGALAAGLKVGVYWFIYALNKNDVISNANRFYEICKPYANKITCGWWADWEYDSDNYCKKNGISLSKTARTDLVKAFCERLKALNCDAGVYANPDYLTSKFNDLTMYKLWLAQYTSKRNTNWNCVMWQYSSKGIVNGIKGSVDMNECYSFSNVPVVNNTNNSTVINNINVEIETIKRGSSGNAVKVWQIIVGAEPDGIFGQDTERLTKVYQKDNNLTVDGIVGANSWKTGLKSL